MKGTYGLFIIEVKRRVKNNKELVWILVIVIFLAAAVFLPKGITGFVSFSIYPEEPSTQQSSDEGFGILPVEEKIEIREETFEILPENESSELNNFLLMNYINKSDGFSISTIGINAPFGITTNGSDFWMTDPGDVGGDNFVYHTDRYGNNITDGFSTLNIGSGTSYGITTNDSDFWIADIGDMFIYHTDRLGNNITDGFSTSASAGIGADNPWGITTNNSDFWILDPSDTFVYHTDRYGNNISDGFCISAACGVGADTTRSITTNGSDFWIVDSAPLGGDSFVYHTDRNGNNISDGFSTLDLSPNILNDITTNNTDLWIVDQTNLFVYHVANNITITNTAPTINLIYITSDDNTKNTTIVNLTGTFSVTDIDGNNMVLNETSWYNNSIEEVGLTNQTNVSYLNTTKNDNWMFSARAYDGTAWSIWTNSSNFTILNTKPNITSIYIYSDANTRNDTNVNLTGTFSYTDLDNDLTTANETKWYNNSIEEVGLRNQTNVSYLNTTKNDNWMFSARAYDGQNWSIWTNSSNFTILNAAPVVYLRTPANNSVSTTALTIFTYNVTDADGNEIDNCTLWIENSTGLAIGGMNTSITIDQNISIYVTLNYETINWSVSCKDSSSAEGNSTKWIYTVNQPVVEQVGGTGGPSHGRAQVIPAEVIPEIPEQPPVTPEHLLEPEPIQPGVVEEIPAGTIGGYQEKLKQGLIYSRVLTFLYLLGIIVAIFLIIKEIRYLRKLKFKHKIKLAKVKENKDYIIVKHKFINLLPKFNKLIIIVLEQIRKRQYSEVRGSYRKLMSLYNKIVIDSKRKDALNILLKEINNKIELAVLKEDVNKEIKKHKIINLKENEELNELHKLIKNKELRTFKFKKENYKAEIPKIKSERIEKKIPKKKVLNEEEKRLNEVHRLIKEGKHIEARKLLR